MAFNGLLGWLSFSFFLVELCSGTTMKILTNHPKVFKNPDMRHSTNNLFGTSIGLSDNSGSLYIGAPKYSYGGGIYRCNVPHDLDGTPNCKILNGFKKYDETKEKEWTKDVRSNNTGFFWKSDDDCSWYVTEDTDKRGVKKAACKSEEVNQGGNDHCKQSCREAEQRLGARDALLGTNILVMNNKVVTCAPREFAMKSFTWKNGMGTCYEIDAVNQPASVKSLFSFNKTLEYYQKKISNKAWERKKGSAILGHSLTWGQKEDEFVFGSPNFNLGIPPKTRYGGFGNILRYGKVTENKGVLNNPYKGRVQWDRFREKLKEEAANIRKQNGTAGDTPGLYLGWSVITGKFSRTSYEKGVDYAFSAPSGKNLTGVVYICPNCFADGKDVKQFKRTSEVNGYQIGERFGHSLCAVDITGDGYDDLVVGAPLHSEDRQNPNTGAIYVFRNMRRGKFELVENFDQGRKKPLTEGAKYGYALLNLGKRNDHGPERFVVGAP